jgi:hypothetical protein
MVWLGLVVVATFVSLAGSGCSGSDGESASSQPVKLRSDRLVPAPPDLRAKCRATAERVGYPVPCPTRVPAGLQASRGTPTCQLDIIGPGGEGGCAKAWQGWVVGSGETGDQHLVLTASPKPLGSASKVVNGPAWYPAARVRRLGWRTVKDCRVRGVFVPRARNEGSAFADHVVLVWTARGHTYAVGFHNVAGVRRALDLDIALARGIELVGPTR